MSTDTIVQSTEIAANKPPTVKESETKLETMPSIKESETKPLDVKSKIEILDINLHMSYNLDYTHVTEHMCKICKRNINAPSLDDVQTGNINSGVSLGKCGHSFHTSCIDKYVKSGNISCPIDMTPWNLNKELDKNITYKKLTQPCIDKKQHYVVAKKDAVK